MNEQKNKLKNEKRGKIKQQPKNKNYSVKSIGIEFVQKIDVKSMISEREKEKETERKANTKAINADYGHTIWYIVITI